MENIKVNNVFANAPESHVYTYIACLLYQDVNRLECKQSGVLQNCLLHGLRGTVQRLVSQSQFISWLLQPFSLPTACLPSFYSPIVEISRLWTQIQFRTAKKNVSNYDNLILHYYEPLLSPFSELCNHCKWILRLRTTKLGILTPGCW